MLVCDIPLWQVLLSLPCITTADLQAFEDALAKTSSPKEQKQHMRSFLLLATGNRLRALAAQKTANVITNVSSKYHVVSTLRLVVLFDGRFLFLFICVV